MMQLLRATAAVRTGLTPDDLPKRRGWTSREEQILIDNYVPGRPRDLFPLLPNHTPASIRNRAYELGLTRKDRA